MGDVYANEIEGLPLSNSPEVFGLHPNAEIIYLYNAAKETWRNLVSMQPRVAGGGGGVSREEHIANVASEIADGLPDEYDMLIVRKALGIPSPCQVVLLQELERYNALLVQMRVSLLELKRALNGEVGMSTVLDELATALFNGQLPGMWRRLAPATEKGGMTSIAGGSRTASRRSCGSLGCISRRHTSPRWCRRPAAKKAGPLTNRSCTPKLRVSKTRLRYRSRHRLAAMRAACT